MRLRLASYNIRKAVGLDWRRDPMRIARVLAEVSPDIALLQEADKRLGGRPAALTAEAIEASGMTVLPISMDGPSLGWHGNAVLVRPGIELRDLRRVDLPALEPRGALALSLDVDGAPLRVGALHLGLLRTWRRRQKSAVLQAMNELGDAPMVLGGDFNEWQLGQLADLAAAGLRPVTPGLSFHAARPMVALDHFVVGPGLDVVRGGVEEGALARRASDHLPIWIDLAPEGEGQAELTGAKPD